MVLNSKGGCGKTTIATNVASHYASKGASVAMVDFDHQRSILDWLEIRPSIYTKIVGLNGHSDALRVPRNTDVVVFDVQAGLYGKDLATMVRRAESIIIPVLSSLLDIRACVRFIQDLLLVGKVSREESKLAVVANRVKENTVVYHKLALFLRSLKIPFIGTLRDSQNYIRAADRGIGLFEIAPSIVTYDLEQWKPIIRWLNSKRSQV